MERTWHQPGTITGTGETMKAVGQARLELSGVSTPDLLSPPPPPPEADHQGLVSTPPPTGLGPPVHPARTPPTLPPPPPGNTATPWPSPLPPPPRGPPHMSAPSGPRVHRHSARAQKCVKPLDLRFTPEAGVDHRWSAGSRAVRPRQLTSQHRPQKHDGLWVGLNSL